MPFDSPAFLFAFLPASLVLVFLTPATVRNVAILASGLLFYSWNEPTFVFIVLASAVVDWILAWQLREGSKGRKITLILCVTQNIALLAYFKYFVFLETNVNAFIGLFGAESLPLLSIALPVGISFIAFEKITYVVDIYKGIAAPAARITDYLAYVFLYPKLLAGPIVKYHEIASQLRQRLIAPDTIAEGATRFCYGLAKKVLIADTAGQIVEKMFALPGHELSFANAWIGALAYSIQIYFDFSAYTDIAIGLALVMGFRLRENFNYPYTSTSFTDFWRRWHISLSTWIREYVYIPLGGSRKGRGRTYVNLWTAFVLSGLWHGATWTFVLWGCYHGAFLVAERLATETPSVHRYAEVIPAVVKRAWTFLFVTIGWVLFRAKDFDQMGYYLGAMFSPEKTGRFVYIRNDELFFVGLGLMMILIPYLPGYGGLRRWARAKIAIGPVGLLCGLALLILSIGKIAASTYSPFLYFRF